MLLAPVDAALDLDGVPGAPLATPQDEVRTDLGRVDEADRGVDRARPAPRPPAEELLGERREERGVLAEAGDGDFMGAGGHGALGRGRGGARQKRIECARRSLGEEEAM